MRSAAAGSAASATSSGGWRSACPHSRHPQWPPAIPSSPSSIDANGRWWFEALWTPRRDAALRRRLQPRRGSAPPGRRRCSVGSGRALAAPAAHIAAVAGASTGSRPVRSFRPISACASKLSSRRTTRTSSPRGASTPPYAASWSAMGRDREPLARALPSPCRRESWATARSRRGPTRATPRALAGSKDRAENVMIVDLMRNGLRRVAEYGHRRVAVARPRIPHRASGPRLRGRRASPPATASPRLLRAAFLPARSRRAQDPGDGGDLGV